MILEDLNIGVYSADTNNVLIELAKGSTIYFCAGCKGVGVQGMDSAVGIDTDRRPIVSITEPTMLSVKKGVFFCASHDLASKLSLQRAESIKNGDTVAVLKGVVTRGAVKIDAGSIIENWGARYFALKETVLLKLNK